jgi:hypothetical protein
MISTVSSFPTFVRTDLDQAAAPRRPLWRRVVAALEAHGRRQAERYFDRLSDADLARLGLDRRTITQNLKAD